MSIATDQRIVLRRGEPPADNEAIQRACDIQRIPLDMLTLEGTGYRAMLLASGVLTKQEEEQVEKALGDVLGILEEHYEAVMNCLDQRDTSDFFTVAQRAHKKEVHNLEKKELTPREKGLTPRAKKRKEWFKSSSRREVETAHMNKTTAPRPSPGVRSVNEYLKFKFRVKQTKFEENMNE